MTRIDNADAGPFTEAEGAQSAGLIGGTFNVDDSRSTSGRTRGQRARGARRTRVAVLQSGKYEGRRHVVAR